MVTEYTSDAVATMITNNTICSLSSDIGIDVALTILKNSNMPLRLLFSDGIMDLHRTQVGLTHGRCYNWAN